MSLFGSINSDLKKDGDFAVPIRISPIIEETENEAKIYSANFVVNNTYYEREELDTELEDAFPIAYLVDESKPVSIGGGLVEFTRTWAELPESWDEWSSYVYTFPGYLYGYSTINSASRAIQVKTVPAKITHDYFLTSDPESDIEIIEGQKYWGVGGAGYPVDGMLLGDISDPTKMEYQTMVSGNDWIVAEDSTFKRWKGNIYQRTTIRVRAQ